jgi:hypothetical protein
MQMKFKLLAAALSPAEKAAIFSPLPPEAVSTRFAPGRLLTFPRVFNAAFEKLRDVHYLSALLRSTPTGRFLDAFSLAAFDPLFDHLQYIFTISFPVIVRRPTVLHRLD